MQGQSIKPTSSPPCLPAPVPTEGGAGRLTLLPLRDCVVIMVEGRYNAEQTVRPLSFGMRSLRVMGNRSSCKGYLFKALEHRS